MQQQQTNHDDDDEFLCTTQWKTSSSNNNYNNIWKTGIIMMKLPHTDKLNDGERCQRVEEAGDAGDAWLLDCLSDCSTKEKEKEEAKGSGGRRLELELEAWQANK
ncbi:hypothetical protein ACLKA7_010538 [Drosophila subpalustris]